MSVGAVHHTRVVLRSAPIAVGGSAIATIEVTQVTQGLTGPSGSSAQAQISTDPGNAVVPGSDNKIFAPQAFTVAARFGEIATNEPARQQARQNLGLQNIDGGTFN